MIGKPVSWEVPPPTPSGDFTCLTTSIMTEPLSVLVLRTSPCFSLCGDKTDEKRTKVNKHQQQRFLTKSNTPRWRGSTLYEDFPKNVSYRFPKLPKDSRLMMLSAFRFSRLIVGIFLRRVGSTTEQNKTERMPFDPKTIAIPTLDDQSKCKLTRATTNFCLLCHSNLTSDLARKGYKQTN